MRPVRTRDFTVGYWETLYANITKNIRGLCDIYILPNVKYVQQNGQISGLPIMYIKITTEGAIKEFLGLGFFFCGRYIGNAQTKIFR